MIHHLSFAVHDPLHVAEVVAEFWQGKAIPFLGHRGSFMALSFDTYGTAMEFMPKGTVLNLGLQEMSPSGLTAPTPILLATQLPMSTSHWWRYLRESPVWELPLKEMCRSIDRWIIGSLLNRRPIGRKPTIAAFTITIFGVLLKS